jgi:hypothetical protein
MQRKDSLRLKIERDQNKEDLLKELMIKLEFSMELLLEKCLLKHLSRGKGIYLL